MGKRITEEELLSMDMDSPEDMAKLFARVLANTVTLGEEIDMLSTKLRTIGDMVMVLCMHSEDRTLTGKILQLMMDNKEFVAYAGEMASKTASGPGSLRMHLLDNLTNLTSDQVLGNVKIKNV